MSMGTYLLYNNNGEIKLNEDAYINGIDWNDISFACQNFGEADSLLYWCENNYDFKGCVSRVLRNQKGVTRRDRRAYPLSEELLLQIACSYSKLMHSKSLNDYYYFKKHNLISILQDYPTNTDNEIIDTIILGNALIKVSELEVQFLLLAYVHRHHIPDYEQCQDVAGFSKLCNAWAKYNWKKFDPSELNIVPLKLLLNHKQLYIENIKTDITELETILLESGFTNAEVENISKNTNAIEEKFKKLLTDDIGRQELELGKNFLQRQFYDIRTNYSDFSHERCSTAIQLAINKIRQGYQVFYLDDC